MFSIRDLVDSATNIGTLAYNRISGKQEEDSLKNLENRLRIVIAISKKTGQDHSEAIARLKARISAKKNTLSSIALSTTQCALSLLGGCSKAVYNSLELARTSAILGASSDTASAEGYSAANVAILALDAIAASAQAKATLDSISGAPAEDTTAVSMQTVSLVAAAASTAIKSRDQIAKVASVAKNALFPPKTA